MTTGEETHVGLEGAGNVFRLVELPYDSMPGSEQLAGASMTWFGDWLIFAMTALQCGTTWRARVEFRSNSPAVLERVSECMSSFWDSLACRESAGSAEGVSVTEGSGGGRAAVFKLSGMETAEKGVYDFVDSGPMVASTSGEAIGGRTGGARGAWAHRSLREIKGRRSSTLSMAGLASDVDWL